MRALRSRRGASRPSGGRASCSASAGSAARQSSAAAGQRGANEQPRQRRGRVRRPAADHGQRRCARGAPGAGSRRAAPGCTASGRAGAEQPAGRGLLDDLARVHDDHLVGVGRGQAQVVADQDQRHAELGLQLEQQLHDLRLGGHVERGGGLVGDQQPGPAGQRDRDHDALPHAAGQLVRVLVEAPLGGGMRTSRSSSTACSCASALLTSRCVADRLGDLRADPHRRVQRPGRVLEHHRHVRAAVLAQLGRRTGRSARCRAAGPSR